MATLVGDTIWVLFTEEIDEHSIWEGNLTVYGPSNNTIVGPGAATQLPDAGPLIPSVLSGPVMNGVVQGQMTFQRIDLNDLNISSAVDTIGSGVLYRSMATFTPQAQLGPEVTYTVLLAGNQDDTTLAGIKPRSIFDPIFTGVGSSNLTFLGTYDGDESTIPNDTLNITVVSSGVANVATCQWAFASSPAAIIGPVLATSEAVDFGRGINGFFGDGVFNTGDKFSILLQQQNPFSGFYSWNFTTASLSIQTPPASTATSVIGDLVPVTITAPQFGFTMNPYDRGTNLNPTPITQILLNFATPLQASTVTSDNILIMGEPVNGDPTLLAPREIYKSMVVTSGLVTMTIT